MYQHDGAPAHFSRNVTVPGDGLVATSVYDLGWMKNLVHQKKALFCPSSWATGLCEDLNKQNKGVSRYNPNSNDLDRSAIGTPIYIQKELLDRTAGATAEIKNIHAALRRATQSIRKRAAKCIEVQG
ncbi:hypothetical protein J6590_058429 [Homalodisca vitripennis]|nr:hypothetical protein J6590_058429 [Homalodisca vitripennis]